MTSLTMAPAWLYDPAGTTADRATSHAGGASIVAPIVSVQLGTSASPQVSSPGYSSGAAGPSLPSVATQTGKAYLIRHRRVRRRARLVAQERERALWQRDRQFAVVGTQRRSAGQPAPREKLCDPQAPDQSRGVEIVDQLATYGPCAVATSQVVEFIP